MTPQAAGMDLPSYVRQHVQPAIPERDTPKVDLTLAHLELRGEPDAETLRRLVREHRGVFLACDPLDGEPRSYTQLGGWIGDQGDALAFMALCHLLGLAQVAGPAQIMPAETSPELRMKLARDGYVLLQARKPERWRIEYRVPAMTGSKVHSAGPYDASQVAEHERDIAGYEGVTDVRRVPA